jgi:hypothetical protein
MIAIERNVPLPPKMECKYPFRDLEVGDSFFVVVGQHETFEKVRARLMSSMRRQRPRQFTMRTIGDGVRVWRIA